MFASPNRYYTENSRWVALLLSEWKSLSQPMNVFWLVQLFFGKVMGFLKDSLAMADLTLSLISK